LNLFAARNWIQIPNNLDQHAAANINQYAGYFPGRDH